MFENKNYSFKVLNDSFPDGYFQYYFCASFSGFQDGEYGILELKYFK